MVIFNKVNIDWLYINKQAINEANIRYRLIMVSLL